jgi:hypothetical protein
MVLPFAAKQKGSRARHKRRSWHGLGVLIAVLKRVVGRWWFYSKENWEKLGLLIMSAGKVREARAEKHVLMCKSRGVSYVWKW